MLVKAEGVLGPVTLEGGRHRNECDISAGVLQCRKGLQEGRTEVGFIDHDQSVIGEKAGMHWPALRADPIATEQQP
ncbi:hypothetical protein D3C86_2129580 [compost metagenome]